MNSPFSPPAPGTTAGFGNALNGYNQSINEYQDLARTQAQKLNEFTGQQQNTISNAYKTAMGETGLQSDIDAMNKIQNALTSTQNASAAVVPQTYEAAKGSFSNNQQVATQADTTNIPYAEQIARLSANLVPAENAYTTAADQTKNIAGNIVTGAQLAEQGFSMGQQNELAALQAKVNQGAALTQAEYQTYATLKAAQTQASATIQSAQIGANASKFSSALSNPGIKVSFDANGNPNGISYLDTPTTPDSKTPSGISLNDLKSQLATELVKNPQTINGNDSQTIAQIMAQSGLSRDEATNLYYSVRKPFESLLNPQVSQDNRSFFGIPVNH